ncbi:MAG: hypothetical protein AAB867_02170 [Patescibacteria group bacterium]
MNIKIIFMKATGYLFVTLWIAALGGFLAFTYSASQPAWNELAARLSPAPTAGAASEAAPASNPRPSFVSETDRDRLNQGLASLAATLEGYRARIGGQIQ